MINVFIRNFVKVKLCDLTSIISQQAFSNLPSTHRIQKKFLLALKEKLWNVSNALGLH